MRHNFFIHACDDVLFDDSAGVKDIERVEFGLKIEK
jgi:hypothetical protein